MIEGSLRTNKWDKDGQTHYTTEINVIHVELLGDSRRQDRAQNQQGGKASKETTHEDFNDDIPF
jgi:single-stranded DNA-binding protein